MEKESNAEKILKEKMADHFLNLAKNINHIYQNLDEF